MGNVLCYVFLAKVRPGDLYPENKEKSKLNTLIQ